MKKSQRPPWLGEDHRVWDHVRVHVQLMRDPRLGAAEIAVYAGLAVHAELSTGDARPAKETLGAYTRLSVRAVYNALRTLETTGYIAVERRTGVASIYRLLPPPAMPDPGTPCRGSAPPDEPSPEADPAPTPAPVDTGLRHQVPTNKNQEQEPRTTTPPTPPQAGGVHDAAGSVASDPEPQPAPSEPPPSEPAPAAEPQALTLLEPPTAPAVPEPPAPTFADFYALWPRHVDKGAADRAWRKAMKAGVDPAVIVAAARRIAKAVATVRERGTPAEQSECDRFMPYPSSWLNAHGWEDDPLAMSAFQRFVARARGFSPAMSRQEASDTLGERVTAKLDAERAQRAMRDQIRRPHSDTVIDVQTFGGIGQ